MRFRTTIELGHTYRSTVATMGGVFMLPLSAENRTSNERGESMLQEAGQV